MFWRVSEVGSAGVKARIQVLDFGERQASFKAAWSMSSGTSGFAIWPCQNGTCERIRVMHTLLGLGLRDLLRLSIFCAGIGLLGDWLLLLNLLGLLLLFGGLR